MRQRRGERVMNESNFTANKRIPAHNDEHTPKSCLYKISLKCSDLQMVFGEVELQLWTKLFTSNLNLSNLQI